MISKLTSGPSRRVIFRHKEVHKHDSSLDVRPPLRDICYELPDEGRTAYYCGIEAIQSAAFINTAFRVLTLG